MLCFGDGDLEPLLVTDNELCSLEMLNYNGCALIDGQIIEVAELLPLFEKAKARIPSILSSVYSNKIRVDELSLDYMRDQRFLRQPYLNC